MTTIPLHYNDMKLVTQDTNVSCGIAVLAMICGTTTQQMKQNLKGEEQAGPVEWRAWLKQYGIELEMSEYTDWESLWFLVVPSPNKHGATHVVILDARPCRDGHPARWYDPQDGNHRSLHWTYDDWINGRVVHAVAYRIKGAFHG